MTEEMDDLENQDEQTDETPKGVPDYKVAYEKEQRARRRAERQLRFHELKVSHPTIEWDIFEGVDPKKWDALAERLSQATAPPQAAEPQQESPTPKQPSPTEEALAKAAALSGASGSPKPEVMSTAEALKHFKGDDAGYRDYLAQKYRT